uniref:Uncharacterized protein n=1 Tax=Knipowitschia caucasica TaxID=637954 RepID=A0AAV2ML13_KNICA
MATSSPSSSFSPPPEFRPPTEAVSEDNLQLNRELETMTEEMENISVQLTCLAYEMVTLRANPELAQASPVEACWYLTPR